LLSFQDAFDFYSFNISKNLSSLYYRFLDDLLSQFSTYLLVDISSFEIELNENNQLKEPLIANIKKIMTIIDLEYSILGIKAFTNHLKEILKSL
jgi:hypothetical protein